MKIRNPKSEIRNQQGGFTLVELLAVMVIFVAISGIVGGIIVSTLRGSNKTNTLASVRRNGNYVISVMSRTIRNAQSLQSPASCVPPPVPTPSLSPVSSIAVKAIDGSVITFSCDDANATIASGSASLLDTSLAGGVAVEAGSCSFVCTQKTELDYPTITIRFTLTQKNPSALFEQKGHIPFATTVTMRNFGD